MDDAFESIIVALDVPTLEQALHHVQTLKDHVGYFKVGLELITAEGAPRVVRAIHEAGGRIMFDGKFADIPNTIANATKIVAQLGCEMFTMHTSCGNASIAAAVAHRGKSKVIGVTVLTSIDEKECATLFFSRPDQKVLELACDFVERGGDAIVCSPQEVALLRSDPKIQKLEARRHANGLEPLMIITPGVRPTWAAAGDQKRIMTPTDAIRSGATHLVIGRPILQPPKEIGTPIDAAIAIATEIDEAGWSGVGR